MSKSNTTLAALRRQPRIRVDLPRELADHVRERAQAEGRSRDEVIWRMAAEALKAEREARGLAS